MNIQIFGKSKCFETKKVERYFKEHKIKYQMIDVQKFGMSKRELESVKKAVGGFENIVDEKVDGAHILFALAYEQDKEEKLLENPKLLKTPIVRNGKNAVIGCQIEVFKKWIAMDKT